MFTAYDWMKPARKQNNFQKDLGMTWESFPGARKWQESLFSSQNLREKDLLIGKTLMIWISTEKFD